MVSLENKHERNYPDTRGSTLAAALEIRRRLRFPDYRGVRMKIINSCVKLVI